tara:strand:+ start:1240 stop:1494 length:255 start_codon:yes stop_codon:yes gene_type:complete
MKQPNPYQVSIDGEPIGPFEVVSTDGNPITKEYILDYFKRKGRNAKSWGGALLRQSYMEKLESFGAMTEFNNLVESGEIKNETT